MSTDPPRPAGRRTAPGRCRRRLPWVLLGLTLASPATHAQSATPPPPLVVAKVGDTVVDPRARTIQGNFGLAIHGLSFQQDALTSHRGHQYVSYYDDRGRVCVARRKLPAGPWQVVRLGDYLFKSDDAHNTISMGICPQDDTIHLAWDHHGHPLHYRVSRRGAAAGTPELRWEAALFGPITDQLEPGKPIRITYPRFWQTPDGGLQFCYRRGSSGNGDRMLADYDARTGTWTGTRPIDSGKGVFTDAVGDSKTRCSYPNGYDYGPDGRLHVTWVWRESSQGANHDLLYAYSKDRGRTWFNNRDQRLVKVPWVGSPDLVVAPISRQHGLMNTHGQAIDSRGRVHVVVWHCTDASLRAAGSAPGQHRWGPPAARRYHHYWRDPSGRWHHRELPGRVGSRAKILIGDGDDAFVITSDQRSKALRPTHGHLEILHASARQRWQDWRVVHTERGPFVNEMLADRERWRRQRILSILVQQHPTAPRQPTPLRILDFSVTGGTARRR